MSKVKDILSKSQATKQARSGKDMGKKGKNFSKISNSVAAEYGSKESGDRVAGAIFQKLRRRGKL